MITLELIQQHFPTGDRIEYQTNNGFFTGVIVGYVIEIYGISLDLGDRRFPIGNEKYFEMAKKYHISAHSENATDRIPKLVQLTLF